MTTRALTVRGIPAHQYPQHRERILPFLANFAARDLDGQSVDGFERDIINREQQVWCIGDFQALALTSLTEEAVRITHCAGVRRHEWQHVYEDEMKRWAQALGKSRVIALVRPGWSKWLRERGYREKHREMCLEI